jgi:hypothetical protein
MKNFIRKIKDKRSLGFVLLFTIVLVSIILSITIGISSVALKEIQFTISGKDANDAFFAANAGAECALYLDKPFPGPAAFSAPNPPNYPSQPFCAGVALFSVIWNAPLSFNFSILVPNSNQNGCAVVDVVRTISPPSMTIISKGYNSCTDLGVPISSTRLVERELEVNY